MGDNMKKIIKIIIVIIFILLFVLMGFLLFIQYNKNKQQIIVLSYHNIVQNYSEKNLNEYETITVTEFEEQLKYLKENNYQTISADEFLQWKENNLELPDKSVLITFDDGYYSFKYLIQPLLIKYNYKAICFLIGNTVNDVTPEYNPHVNGTIGKDEIFNHISNVEYGSHTYAMHFLDNNNLPLVKTLNAEELKNDIKTFNNEILNAKYLAYPYYTYTSEYIKILKENNYKLAFAGEEEMATRDVDNFKIPRISGAKHFEEFKNIFETSKYRNKYGNGIIRKVFVNIERFFKANH